MEKDVSICVIMCCLGGGSVGRNVGGSTHEPDKESGKGEGGEEGTGTAGGDPWRCVPQMKITFFCQTLNEISQIPHNLKRFNSFWIVGGTLPHKRDIFGVIFIAHGHCKNYFEIYTILVFSF